MMVEKKSWLKVLRIRMNSFFTLRKEVFFLAITSAIIILFSELIFKHINSFNRLQYDLGQIIIKLSYSYTSAFLFYFLVVHLPKEEKKLKSFDFMNAQIGSLGDHIDKVCAIVFFKPEKQYLTLRQDITRSEFMQLCSTVSNTEVFFVNNTYLTKTFQSRSHYITYEAKIIYSKTHELMLYTDIIENNIFEVIAELNSYSSFTMNNNPTHPDYFISDNLQNTFGTYLYKIYVLKQKLEDERIKFAKKYSLQANYLEDKKKKKSSFKQYYKN